MTKAFVTTSFGILLLACSLRSFALPQAAGVGQKLAKTAVSKNASSDAGERAFRANCGRCHNPPDSLSPREVKAVVRQMRVRGTITAQDEQLIRKYLAP